MDNIEEKLSLVRDKINAKRKQAILLQDKKNRNKLCACLDTIWDVQVAIHEYNKLPDDSDSLYLPIYWLLQGLYLQTDAVGHLHQAIIWSTIKFNTEYPNLQNIRELRNDIVWHPTSRRDKKSKEEIASFHVIGRITMSKKWFTAINYCPDSEDIIKHIDIIDAIKKQQLDIYKIIDSILDFLIKEELEHKKNFQNEKIVKIIPDIFGYHISKLYESIHSNYVIPRISLQSIDDIFKNIKNEIIKRYTTYDFYQHEMDKIEYIITYLFNVFDWKISKDWNEIEIHIDVLKMEFENLKEILKEIDNEFLI